MAKTITTNKETGRRTVEDVAEADVRYAVEQAKANKEPELTSEEKAKIRLDKWKAMHGLDLDSRD